MDYGVGIRGKSRKTGKREMLVKNLTSEESRILVNPAESHPEQRGHGSSRESRGERCEDRKGFPRWGKSLSFGGTYQYPYLQFHLALICLLPA